MARSLSHSFQFLPWCQETASSLLGLHSWFIGEYEASVTDNTPHSFHGKSLNGYFILTSYPLSVPAIARSTALFASLKVATVALLTSDTRSLEMLYRRSGRPCLAARARLPTTLRSCDASPEWIRIGTTWLNSDSFYIFMGVNADSNLIGRDLRATVPEIVGLPGPYVKPSK